MKLTIRIVSTKFLNSILTHIRCQTSLLEFRYEINQSMVPMGSICINMLL